MKKIIFLAFVSVVAVIATYGQLVKTIVGGYQLPPGAVEYYTFQRDAGATTTIHDTTGNSRNCTLAGAEGPGNFSGGVAAAKGSFAWRGLTGLTLYENPTIFATCPASVLSTASSMTFVYVGRSVQLPTGWARVWDYGQLSSPGTPSQYIYFTPNAGSGGPGVTAGLPTFGISVGGSAAWKTVQFPVAMSTTIFQVYTVVLNHANSTLTAYLDGTQVAQTASVTIQPSDITGTHQWIGQSAYSGDPLLKSDLMRLGVWNRALSANEVYNLSNQLLNEVSYGVTSAPPTAWTVQSETAVVGRGSVTGQWDRMLIEPQPVKSGSDCYVFVSGWDQPPGNGPIAIGYVGYAKQTGCTGSYVKNATPILSPDAGSTWYRGWVNNPNYIYNPFTNKHMITFTGSNSTGFESEPGTCGIMEANSIEGPYTVVGKLIDVGTAGSWDDAIIYRCTLSYDTTDTMWKLFYNGKHSPPWREQIGYAYSSDTTLHTMFTKYAGNPVITNNATYTSQLVADPTIYKQGNGQYLLAISTMDTSINFANGYWTSPDLVNGGTWTANPLNILQIQSPGDATWTMEHLWRARLILMGSGAQSYWNYFADDNMPGYGGGLDNGIILSR